MKTTTRKTSANPSKLAAHVVAEHLSPDELYGVMLDRVSAEDLRLMEDAIIARWAPKRLKDPNEREMATLEAYFMLGLEIGKRIGGGAGR